MTNRRQSRDCLIIGLAWAGSAAISIGMWAGIAVGLHAGGRWAVMRLESSWGNVAQNVRWLWTVGNENGWMGPMRWGIATSLVMMLGWIGVGVWEWIQRRNGKREDGGTNGN